MKSYVVPGSQNHKFVRNFHRRQFLSQFLVGTPVVELSVSAKTVAFYKTATCAKWKLIKPLKAKNTFIFVKSHFGSITYAGHIQILVREAPF